MCFHCVSISYNVFHQTIHLALFRIRLYYHWTRWYLGDDYQPFVTPMHQQLHPNIIFHKRLTNVTRMILLAIERIFPMCFLKINFSLIGLIYQRLNKKPIDT